MLRRETVSPDCRNGKGAERSGEERRRGAEATVL